ncbi:ribosome production factor 2 homolog [Nylanderia fulva]|uniref:ribosome production factor 2 homolog n=1 Tax=Nylanderia fulva TaxID=613905 RepID=UPI0010FBAE27|nr:ribosome production factor 2 homolog [Nylanderia fulva]
MERKKVLALSNRKEFLETLRDISSLRGDCTVKLDKEKKNYFDTPPKTSELFISVNDRKNGDKILTMGRSFDGEYLELMEFTILESKPIKESKMKPEIGAKYFLVFQGVDDPRIQNFFIDFLNCGGKEVSLDCVLYSFIISRIGDTLYTVKYVKILDSGLEEVGPSFLLESKRMYFCDEETFKRACYQERPKKARNVKKNEFNDRIGRVHIEKQDLRDIRIRKKGGYKDMG